MTVTTRRRQPVLFCVPFSKGRYSVVQLRSFFTFRVPGNFPVDSHPGTDWWGPPSGQTTVACTKWQTLRTLSIISDVFLIDVCIIPQRHVCRSICGPVGLNHTSAWNTTVQSVREAFQKVNRIILKCFQCSQNNLLLLLI